MKNITHLTEVVKLEVTEDIRAASVSLTSSFPQQPLSHEQEGQRAAVVAVASVAVASPHVAEVAAGLRRGRDTEEGRHGLLRPKREET